MIVNLNCPCKVKLNELGKVIWLSQLDGIPEDVKKANPELVAAIKSQIDEDDCIEADLWVIMNIFGRYLSPAHSPFRSTCIQLDKKPNVGLNK